MQYSKTEPSGTSNIRLIKDYHSPIESRLSKWVDFNVKIIKVICSLCISLALIFTSLLLSSCKNEYRLKQDFDSEALNTVPATSPPPNPPNDNTTWTQQRLTPKIVVRPDGGQWVNIQIKPNYIGPNVAQALNAFSDYFKSGKNIRGNMTLRMTGSGRVIVGLQTAQNAQLQGSPLGGYALRSDLSADIAYLNSNQIGSILDQQQYFGPLGFGTFLAPYTLGNTIEFAWSIDQASRTLSLSVFPGGANNQVTFPAAFQGIANTPIQRLWLIIYVIDFNQNTTLFIDDLSIEEEM